MGYSRGISYPLVGSIPCRPPRVRTITFISQPPHLLYGVRVALDFFLSCRVVRPKSALYEVSVRRPETLPVLALLSLHIRLPSDPTSRWAPLPSASGSCYRVRSGLSPPSYRPCRAHTKITAGIFLRLFFSHRLQASFLGFPLYILKQI